MNGISARLDSVPVSRWPLVTAGGCWGALATFGGSGGDRYHGVCAVGKVRLELLSLAVP